MCKNIFNMLCTTENDAVIVVKVRNQEDNIEGIIRSIVWKSIDNGRIIPEILVVDLDSTDDTPDILERLSVRYDFIKVTDKQGYIDYLLECQED